VVEITQRTIQGRFLLKPSRKLNRIVAGCIARAQTNMAVQIHAIAVLSNHLHLLATFDTVEQMAQFMCQLKANLSKEVGRLHDWPGPMWAGRYKSIPLSDEPEIQHQRLKYILSQGAKEGLVLSPKDWPGVHCARALVEGRSIPGVWIDRTKLYSARQKGEDVTEADYTSQAPLHLMPLPCMAALSRADHRRRVAEIVEEIEEEALAMHDREGTVPLGVEKVCRSRAHERPYRLARSNRPYFHATKRVFAQLMDGLREFLAQYRVAAERLASGDHRVVFPENCYPPGLPFVRPAMA